MCSRAQRKNVSKYDVRKARQMEIVKVHNRFDKVVRDDALGVPMTPSNWIKEPEYKNIMVVGLSYGGGLGGSYREMYCTRINNIFDALRNEQFIEVERIDGEKEIINTRFVVSVHSNYQLMITYMDNRNTNFKVGINQYNYLVPNGHKVKLISSYESWR